MQTPPATSTSPTGPRNADNAGGAVGDASVPCLGFDDEYGVSCEREAGHDGNHRADIGDGGRVAWPASRPPVTDEDEQDEREARIDRQREEREARARASRW